MLESVEDLRVQIRQATAGREPSGAAVPTAPDLLQDTQPYRPAARPPMGLLCVLDDDGDGSGEMVRVRASPFVIGRVEGNLVIPHDGGISGRHAEITRRLEGGEYRWYLKDLQSTNGTFVRASTVILNPEQELLIGHRRFRIEATAQAPEPPPTSGPEANGTRKWSALTAAELGTFSQTALVETSPGREGRRIPLLEQEYWLGRDPKQCGIVVDDPAVDRRHAKLSRDGTGRWVIANARSLNGLWARVQEVALGRGGFFQCGEQRFLFKAL